MGIQQFWNLRPFSRVVMGFKARLKLKEYIQINQLESLGYDRFEAKVILEEAKAQQRRNKLQ